MSETRRSSSQALEAPVEAGSGDPTVVCSSISVGVGIERAFAVFASQMGSWWHPEHHINGAPMAALILEPRVGGRWYELGTDGSQCDWGVVLAWEPPRHLAVSWHLDGEFQYDPETTHASRVDVWFRTQDDGTTLVQLAHSGLDHHGPSWRRLRDAVASPEGWPEGLRRFAAAMHG